MTVFMLLVAEIIPPTSDAVSIISTFYSCCIFEVRYHQQGHQWGILMKQEDTLCLSFTGIYIKNIFMKMFLAVLEF